MVIVFIQNQRVLSNYTLYTLFCTISNTRRVATVGTSGLCPPPHFNFRIKQGPTVFISNIRDNAFYGCSEILLTKNFAIFTKYATIFEQLTAPFHFF